MSYNDWFVHFNNLYVCKVFPDSWYNNKSFLYKLIIIYFYLKNKGNNILLTLNGKEKLKEVYVLKNQIFLNLIFKNLFQNIFN